MRKVIILILIGYVVGFCGCTEESKNEYESEIRQANAQVSTMEYNCITFLMDVPEGWKLEGTPGTNVIVGHVIDDKFDKESNTFWDLKVTSYVNDKNPGKNFAKDMAKAVAHRKNGAYVGKIELDNVILYEADYTVGTFTQKEFFGISSVKETNGQFKYYNIDFTLENCPDDFYKSAMKLLDKIKFNFTFNF